MTHKLDADDYFIHRIQRHCADHGLNFFLVEPLWVEAFCDRLAKGKLWARALLNMHSEHHLPDDIYHRLVKLAHERGVHIIDPPDLAWAAFNKAALHPRLVEAGFAVPQTLIVDADAVPSLRLTPDQRMLLDSPFVVKPSMGYGKRGVLLDATGEADVSKSAAQWPDAHYLLQRKILPKRIDGEPAYFRVFTVFGHVWSCWWNCHTDHYRRVTVEEHDQLGLAPLSEIALRLATLTRMRFFSSEIALTESGDFVLIDYVNDQCHMLSQSARSDIGVPDSLIRDIAERLVHSVATLVRPAP